MQFSHIVYIKVTVLSIVFSKKILNSLDINEILLYNKMITHTGVKNMKKLIAILLVLVMTLSLFACGDGKKDEKPDNNNETPDIGENDGGENNNEGSDLPGEEDGNDEIENEVVENPASPESYGLGGYIATVTVSKIVYQIFEDGAVVFDSTCPKDVIEIPEQIEYTKLADGSIVAVPVEGCTDCGDIIVGEKNTTTVKIVGYAAFYNTSASEIKLPETITSIEDNAFRNAVSLTKVNFPASLAKIGDKAFAFTGFTSVNIESEIEYGTYVYYACDALTAATTDSGIKVLPAGVFACCKNLSEVTLASTITEIADDAFFCCYNLEAITIPANTVSIGNKSFYCCKALGEIEVPGTVKTIGSSAFYNCESAEKITLGNSVVSLGDFALYGCKGLTSITVPSSVKTLGKGVFGALSVSAITLPSGIDIIPEMTFINSKNLKDITIKGRITGILDKAFSGTAIESFTVPASVAGNIGTYAFENCKALRSFRFDCKLEKLATGIFSGCTALKDIKIPSGVASIEDYAFNKCSSLTDLAIPKSVTAIGSYAFNGCTLVKQLDISATNIETIGTYAFAGCATITSMTLPKGITVIPSNLFDGCSSLKSVKFLGDVTEISAKGFAGCAALEKVTVSNALTTIGTDAFRGCTNLREVNLGEGVTKIERAAFYNCPNLTSLYIGKSVTSIGGYAVGFVDSPDMKEGDKAQPLVNENFVATGYFGTTFEAYVESFKDVNGNVIKMNGLGRIGDSAFEDFEYEVVGKIEISELVRNQETGEDELVMVERDAVKIVKYNGKDADVVVPASFGRVDLFVVEIADNAFSGNKNVVSVKLPTWIAAIGNEAFANCVNLKTVQFVATSYTLPEDAEEGAVAGELAVGADVFKNSPDVTVYAPSGSYVALNGTTLGWNVKTGAPPVSQE